MGSAFPDEKTSGGLDRKAFWKHSLACAICSKILAQKIKSSVLIDPEECFCAGLLHDIGRLVLDQYFKQNFIGVLEQAAAEKCSLYEVEKREFGCTHANIGDWLTSKWELPRDLRIPLIYHHEPSESPMAAEKSFIIHLADFISNDHGLLSCGIEAYPDLHPDTLSILKLNQQDVDSISEQIIKEIEHLEAAFSFA